MQRARGPADGALRWLCPVAADMFITHRGRPAAFAAARPRLAPHAAAALQLAIHHLLAAQAAQHVLPPCTLSCADGQLGGARDSGTLLASRGCISWGSLHACTPCSACLLGALRAPPCALCSTVIKI